MSEDEPAAPGSASAAGWHDVDATGDADDFRAYLDRVTGLASARAVKERSRRLLRPEPGDRLLDVGCGTGADVRALAAAVGPDGSALGVDASAELLGEARERTDADADVDFDAPGATFATADAHALPVATGAVDGVRADRVLQHLADPGAAYGELVRVARPGGRVVVTEPDWGTLVATAPGVDPAANRRALDPERACARNGRVGRRLRAFASDAGLVDVDVDAATLAFTTLREADEVLGLAGRVDSVEASASAVGVGGRRWYGALERADAEDAFHASLALFTVAGTKPEPGAGSTGEADGDDDGTVAGDDRDDPS